MKQAIIILTGIVVLSSCTMSRTANRKIFCPNTYAHKKPSKNFLY